MSKHTPGEWKLRPLQKVSQPHGEASTYRRRIMVDGPPPFTFVCTLDFGYGHPEQDEANARLIAAAPELLGVCEQLIQKADNSTDDTEIDSSGWTKYVWVSRKNLIALETAIRKAGGE